MPHYYKIYYVTGTKKDGQVCSPGSSDSDDTEGSDDEDWRDKDFLTISENVFDQIRGVFGPIEVDLI